MSLTNKTVNLIKAASRKRYLKLNKQVIVRDYGVKKFREKIRKLR